MDRTGVPAQPGHKPSNPFKETCRRPHVPSSLEIATAWLWYLPEPAWLRAKTMPCAAFLPEALMGR